MAPRETVSRSLWKATVLCAVAAAPSFLLALTTFDPLGMTCGVATFVVLYAIGMQTEMYRCWCADRRIVRALRVAYGTRVLVSIILPVGAMVDMVPGIIAVQMVSGRLGGKEGFWGTYAITLLQGVFLNILVGMFALTLYAIFRRTMIPKPDYATCHVCGYNLTGNVSGKCPECGAAVLSPAPRKTPSAASV